MPLAITKLRPGDPAPDLLLPAAANGQEVSLRECFLEGPVLIEFIRGTWCPEGRERLAELASARGSFRAARTRVLVVICEELEKAQRWLEANPSPLAILIDAGRRTARDYGVLQRTPWSWNVARPASFVIDRAGFIRKVFVSRLPTERAPVADLLAALAEFGDGRRRASARSSKPEA